MTLARKLTSAGATVALAAILAGCMSAPQSSGPIRVAAPMRSPVEGAWIDAQGTGLSTFSGGVFQTVATDTGQKLSEGSYVNSQNSVQINGTSLIRQSPISFNCLLVSTSQLNCTSSAGTQFVLTKRA
jgi:hypothetical protein